MGQAIDAGQGIQNSLLGMGGLYGQNFGQSLQGAGALGQNAAGMMGTYGNLLQGNESLALQSYGQHLQGAQGMIGAGNALSQNYGSLAPALAMFPQEKSRLNEANLARWYQERLRYAMGPPGLSAATGYATNFPQQTPPYSQGSSGWPGALGAIGGGLMASMPYWGPMLGSSRDWKEDIEPADSILEKLKTLPMFTWRYKGDSIKHIGPMAQDFQKTFGVGDGKHLFLPDMLSVIMGSMKELANANA